MAGLCSGLLVDVSRIELVPGRAALRHFIIRSKSGQPVEGHRFAGTG
jgi:hypothetical protein